MLKINIDILQDIDYENVLLPACPQVAINLLKAKNNPNLTINSFIKLIELDPSLSMNLLKIARSNTYNKKANTEYCKDLKTAISTVLGLETALNLSLGLALCSIFCDKNSKNITNTSFWLHSIAVALIAKFIAHKFTIIDYDQAYLAGLTHDIGHLVLHSILKEDYLLSADMAFTIENDKETFNNKELESYTLKHCIIGQLLIAEWELPECLEYVCKYHHDKNYDKKYKELVNLIQLSENILAHLKLDDNKSLKRYKNIYLTLSQIGVSYEDLESSFDTLNMIVSDYRKSIINRL